MALQKPAVSASGFSADQAYHRVESIILQPKNMMGFRVRTYINGDCAYPAFSDMGYTCAYVLDGPNPYAQAYVHLKTLPTFSGSVDV